jgi:hypothetical protein
VIAIFAAEMSNRQRHQSRDWLAVNDLILNAEKTKALFFQGRSLSTIGKLK